MKRLFYRTKRPWWVRIFRTVGYFLLFFLSPLCFILGDMLSRVVFADTGSLKYLSLVLFIVSVTMSLPFAYLLLIQKLRKRMITILHFSLQAVLIGGLLLANSISLHFSGSSKYYFRYGNCSTALGGVLQSSWGQSLYAFVIESFPLTTQYAVSTLEDTCRINMLKIEIAADPTQICGASDVDQCVGELFSSINRTTSLSAGGMVLGNRYRLLLINSLAQELEKSQGQLRLEDHLMLSGRLVSASLQGLELLLNNQHLVVLAGEDRLRRFSELSPEDRAYYEIAVRNQFLNMDGVGFGQALSLVFGRTLQGLPNDVDRHIAEYILVSIMDSKLRQDSFTHTQAYIQEVIEKSLKQLNEIGDLPPERVTQIRIMFESFQDRLIALKQQ